MLTLADLAAQFRPDPGRSYRPLVGFEYEVHLACLDTFRPLAYEGDRGLRAVLDFLAQQNAGVLLPGIPASKLAFADGSQISLEPGGQLEFSSAPVGTFAECLEQLQNFIDLLTAVQKRFALHVFYGGANPVRTVDEIGLAVPTERYRIMDAYFPRVGTMGRRMMRQTSSLQVTFDYRDDRLAAQLLRTALFVTPFASALFSHSPFLDGATTGYLSQRVRIWQHTDNSRCGLLPGFEHAGYGLDHYVSHVVRAPMFFVNTDAGLVDAGGMTFERFNREGFGGRRATIEDFLLHNSTIFTDVRLKHTVEVRGLDSQDPALVPAALAFVCGLLMCERIRLRVLDVLEPLAAAIRRDLVDRLGKRGMACDVDGRPAAELFRRLLDVAREGLELCLPDGPDAADHLAPVQALVDKGKTPADVVLERFERDPMRWLAAGRTFSEGEL